MSGLMMLDLAVSCRCCEDTQTASTSKHNGKLEIESELERGGGDLVQPRLEESHGFYRSCPWLWKQTHTHTDQQRADIFYTLNRVGRLTEFSSE